jgi:hypothetical protein
MNIREILRRSGGLKKSRDTFSPTGHRPALVLGRMIVNWNVELREPMAPARRGLSDSRGGRRGKRVSTVPAELSDDGVDLGAVQNLFF